MESTIKALIIGYIQKANKKLEDDRESGDYEVFSYIDKDTDETAISELKEFLKEAKLYLEGLGITF